MQILRNEPRCTLQFTPDGKRLIAAESALQTGSMAIYDIGTWRRTALVAGFRPGFYHFQPLPDNERVALLHLDGAIKTWDMKTGRLLSVGPALPFPRGSPAALAVSPNGRWMVVCRLDRTVEIWDLSAQKLVRTLGPRTQTPSVSKVYTLAWSPDSRRLATAPADPAVEIWDVEALAK
jgi:WD40 repeat protein